MHFDALTPIFITFFRLLNETNFTTQAAFETRPFLLIVSADLPENIRYGGALSALHDVNCL